MSKAEPDPYPIGDRAKSMVKDKEISRYNSNSGFTCHLVVDSLIWNNCEFDIEAYAEQISALFFGKMLKTLGKRFEFSLLLTDDSRMLELNSRYRNKHRPTNTLSFPQLEFEGTGDEYLRSLFEKIEGSVILGDIAISWTTFQEELLTLGVSIKSHFAHLLIHSLLHLIGYNHEQDDEACVMMSKEKTLLKELGISNPYEKL